MSQVQAFRSQSQYSKRSVSENGGQQNPLTSQSIKFYEDPCKDELIQLKEQMKSKEEELLQKNQIIKQLQERCMLVDTYQRKIQNLEKKATQLQKIIDRLQKDDLGEKAHQNISNQNRGTGCTENIVGELNVLKDTNKNNSSKSLTSKQKIPAETKTKGKQSNKENRKSSLKLKDNTKIMDAINQQSKSKSRQKSKDKDKRIYINNNTDAPHTLSCKSIQNIASSKCLNTKKQDPPKFQQIEMKFNKIKENIPNNNKPRSNKTIQEIYTMIHNRKIKGEESYLKQINQKLQTIVDESERLSNGGSIRERDLSFSHHNKYQYQWKNQKDKFFQKLESTRPRSDSYTFQTSFMNSSFGYRPYPETSRQSRHVKFQKKPHTYRSDSHQDAFTPMDSRKFAKIMNSNNVEDMLRARKTFSGIEMPVKGVYNKTLDSYTDRYSTNRVYWN